MADIDADQYAEGFGAGYSQAITDVVRYFQQVGIDRGVVLDALDALIADLRADHRRRLEALIEHLAVLRERP